MTQETKYHAIVMLVERIGFPIVAFILMWYMSNTTIQQNTVAISRLVLTLGGVQ